MQHMRCLNCCGENTVKLTVVLIENAGCNFSSARELFGRDVNNRGLPMTVAFMHGNSAAASSARVAARDSSSADAASDEMLIRRIAAGDQLAMRTLFARHRIPLYRWLVRIVRDDTLAEDLLSDVFLDVWR